MEHILTFLPLLVISILVNPLVMQDKRKIPYLLTFLIVCFLILF